MDIRESLSESLFDLKHDLGKYIRLPVSMLQKDAPWDEVATQVERAVMHTRKGPAGEISAAMLFDRFASEWGAHLADVPAYGAVKNAVSDAIGLVESIRQGDPDLTRERVEDVLGNVSAAIQKLIDEVLNG